VTLSFFSSFVKEPIMANKQQRGTKEAKKPKKKDDKKKNG